MDESKSSVVESLSEEGVKSNEEEFEIEDEVECEEEDEELIFPVSDMIKLEEMITSPRWIAPVQPNGQLEILLNAAILFAKKGADVDSEEWNRFVSNSLVYSFHKILLDEAVSSWKPEIHKCILRSSTSLLSLIILKLDSLPLLSLLSHLFTPSSKFHTFNANRPPESCGGGEEEEEGIFARPFDNRSPKGWLVDLVNHFGNMRGFHAIANRFNPPFKPISVSLLYSILRPFAACADYLTPHTLHTYFPPIISSVSPILSQLSDEELKKETGINFEVVYGIIKYTKILKSRSGDGEESMRELELFRLKMILRMLQVSSFNGKMQALNEINGVLASVSSYSSPYRISDESSPLHPLSQQELAQWLSLNGVLQIALRDSLHHPQYVEKLEEILSFSIKEKTLSLRDLDDLWEAQLGKHERVVKNVTELLAKLAWDFTSEQLDHLFKCFEASWKTADLKCQREKLLELISRLTEDDKEGVMAKKALSLFWNLAYSKEVPTELLDQALLAHVKLLKYSCSQKESERVHWISACVSHLEQSDIEWVIPSLKHLKELFNLYQETQVGLKIPPPHPRQIILKKLQEEKNLLQLISHSLSTYITKVKKHISEKGHSDLPDLKLDERYSHFEQVSLRLDFLHYLIKEGRLKLSEEEGVELWRSLVECPACPIDRELGFEWFSKLVESPIDLEPKTLHSFFHSHVIQFDPAHMSLNGMNCFERFFKQVNLHLSKLSSPKLSDEIVVMDDNNLDGSEFLWRLITSGSEEIASRATRFFNSIYTSLGPSLLTHQKAVHSAFFNISFERLKKIIEVIGEWYRERRSKSDNLVREEMVKGMRVLQLLSEYVSGMDADYVEERAFVPLYRAFRGRLFRVVVKFPLSGNRYEDVEIQTHINESLSGLKRIIYRKYKELSGISSNFKLEIYHQGESVMLDDHLRTISLWGIRDKVSFHAKIHHNNTTNSPDSSEESSCGSPNHYLNGVSDGPNLEAEANLPSVILTRDESKMEFLVSLSSLPPSLPDERLRLSARNLLLNLPASFHTESLIRSTFLIPPPQIPPQFNTPPQIPPPQSTPPHKILSPPRPHSLFNADGGTVLYRLEILYSNLFPTYELDSGMTLSLLEAWLSSGSGGTVVEMLGQNNFMLGTDFQMRRSATTVVLKLTKAVLGVVGQLVLQLGIGIGGRGRVLKRALDGLPNPVNDSLLKRVAQRIVQIGPGCPQFDGLSPLVEGVINNTLPDMETIRFLIKIASSTASGSFASVSSPDQHQENKVPSPDDVIVCEEALEVLTLSFILNPGALSSLSSEPQWSNFMECLLVSSQSPLIRLIGSSNFYAIGTIATSSPTILLRFISISMAMLERSSDTPPTHERANVERANQERGSQERTNQERGSQERGGESGRSYRDLFRLVTRLLRAASGEKLKVERVEEMLDRELEWLRAAKEEAKNGGVVDEELFEGHIFVIRELIEYLSSDHKSSLGSSFSAQHSTLLQEILLSFLFPWVPSYFSLPQSQSDDSPPLLSNIGEEARGGVYDLLVALSTNCHHNLKHLVHLLSPLFNYKLYDESVVSESEYTPSLSPRPYSGFVGLKNGGATCYMNSVLQQLFMLPSIRTSLLGPGVGELSESSSELSLEESGRKGYNIRILREIQNIFRELSLSRLQYYTPTGLWKHFKLQGEAVNLREQQDAVEFFMSLVESVDEGLKALGYEQILTSNLGGIFSDQKICKECHHRYAKEEPFSLISVDIRNHSNLQDSLEQYVKGELLEGADAYHCEHCNKKVVTVKRLCVKKLPPILAIQLKRFKYDYEKLCPIKYNDYFEFPRFLSMEPYTELGLAKLEGEGGEVGVEDGSEYRLTGVVVHSGQASEGHYYSYISTKGVDGCWRWYKFDDGEVSEVSMEDDEELKTQCFGGDYSGEVFDQMAKRMRLRQKRWWNAYIILYTRISNELPSKQVSKKLIVPPSIEKVVLRQKIEFLHTRSHFSHEYFNFIKKLTGTNGKIVTEIGASSLHQLPEEIDNLAFYSVQMAAKFLFTVGFRAKKNLRGNIQEWFDILNPYLKYSKKSRFWLTQAIFTDSSRLSEYLLESPSSDVRGTFAKILAYLAYYSKLDKSDPGEREMNVNEWILENILNLLRRDVSDNGRQLVQYFNFFTIYAQFGTDEKLHLMHKKVPYIFLSLLMDDSTVPGIKFQCTDLSKLYQTIAVLIRSCDVSHLCLNQNNNEAPLENVYAEGSNPLLALPDYLNELIYSRQYAHKLVEECLVTDDSLHLLLFLCWENMGFSQLVLHELINFISCAYLAQIESLLEILLQFLTLDDSWRDFRLSMALSPPPPRKGLPSLLLKLRFPHPKRAYLLLKLLVSLFTNFPLSLSLLSPSSAEAWNSAIGWLGSELERRSGNYEGVYGGGGGYGYPPPLSSSWCPPSNEAETVSFYLDKSESAILTLQRAIGLRIQLYHGQPVGDDEIMSEGEEGDSSDPNCGDDKAKGENDTFFRYAPLATALRDDDEINFFKKNKTEIKVFVTYASSSPTHALTTPDVVEESEDERFEEVSDPIPAIELPDPELDKLEFIQQVLASCLVIPMRREKLALSLESNENFIKKLLICFHVAEERRDTNALHHLFHIFRTIFMLNKNGIFEILFNHELILDVIGCLEYDPDVVSPKKHREYLKELTKYREVLKITNTELLNKIHQTYRVQYIHDSVLPTTAYGENMLITLSSFIFFNKVEIVTLIQEDANLLNDLFSELKSQGIPESRRKDLILFLKELCAFAQNLQPQARESFYKTLTQHGILCALELSLPTSDRLAKSASINVLTAVVEFSPSVVREYCSSQTPTNENFLLNVIIRELISDSDPGQGGAVQLSGVLRMLIDPDNMLAAINKSEKVDFLNLFYKHSMQVLIDPLLEERVESLKDDDLRLAQLLWIVLELLSFCVEHHTYHIKSYIINKDLLRRVLLLMTSSHTFLVLGALRLLRKVVSLKDDLYVRYIIKGNLLAPVFEAFKRNNGRYNLLDSAIIELFEYIKIEEMKVLIAHIVENFSDIIEKVNYVPTFRCLKLRYEQNVQSERFGAGVNKDRSSIESAVTPILRSNRFRRDPRQMEEEIWFNEDEELEDSGEGIDEAANSTPDFNPREKCMCTRNLKARKDSIIFLNEWVHKNCKHLVNHFFDGKFKNKVKDDFLNLFTPEHSCKKHGKNFIAVLKEKSYCKCECRIIAYFIQGKLKKIEKGELYDLIRG